MIRVAKNQYHHGNLREALLTAANEVLEQNSSETLSLRGLAKTVGVSPTAVYSHFTDKTALLMELKTEGFKRLTAFMLSQINELPDPGPEARIRCIGKAYIYFALHHRNLFDILFGWTPEVERFTPECIAAGTGCEGLIKSALIDMLAEHGYQLDHHHSALATFSAWSMAHGIAMLIRSGCVDGSVYCDKWPKEFSSSNPETQAQIIEQVCDIQLAGLRSALPKLIGPPTIE